MKEKLAKARLTLASAVASDMQPAPQMIAWKNPETILLLQTGPAALQITQWQAGLARQHPVWGQEWQAHWESLSAIQRLQCSAQLASKGDILYVHSQGQVWQINLLADASLGPAQLVLHAPLHLAQHGHALHIPEADHGIVCPNGKYRLLRREDNLLLQNLADGSQRYLTCDGEPEAAYGAPLYFGLQIEADEHISRPLIASFSPDGRYILSYRLDYRACHKRQMLKVHADGREQVLRWPEVMTGQAHVPIAQLWLFDIHQQRAVPIYLPADTSSKGQAHPASQFAFFDADYASAFFLRQICWQDGALYLLPWARGRRAAALYRTDLQSGASTLIHAQYSETLLDYPFMPEKCLVQQSTVFFLSEEDGWSHIYQLNFQIENGQSTASKPRQLTRGPWAVRALLACDAQQEYLYFSAGGREAGIDPYYRQLYRLHLASGSITRLTPEDADHAVQLAPDCSNFVDSYARHDLSPQLMWRSNDGALIQQLGAGKIDALLAKGWRPPQAVNLTARDGVSDMFGLLAVPDQLQEGQRYPVIISIYPGCHTSTVPKRLEGAKNHMFFMASLAALGFYVLRLDGMGGPGRSKDWHDVCHHNLADASLPDQVHGLQQLAKRFPQMDLQRVAMIGSSAGGYATARAMFCYPDIFKLGIAAAGNHDLQIEGAEWTEDYLGWPLDPVQLQAQSNPHLARHLQARLLLLHGALDDNVSVAQSLRLGAALLKEHKQFDTLILPDADHAALGTPEAQEYAWRYLLRYL